MGKGIADEPGWPLDLVGRAPAGGGGNGGSGLAVGGHEGCSRFVERHLESKISQRGR